MFDEVVYCNWFPYCVYHKREPDNEKIAITLYVYAKCAHVLACIYIYIYIYAYIYIYIYSAK